MARIHYLNVGSGDCIILQTNSGRVSVIDICSGNLVKTATQSYLETLAELSQKPRGNFGMCSKPTNPLDYLKEIGINSIHRFVLSHPDMDHMDGLNNLFNSFSILNFWDSGVRREKPDFSQGSYNEEDWNRYERIISGNEGLTVISPQAGSCNKYWCEDDSGEGGDYIDIVAPNSELVREATDSEDINDGSYVLVYRSAGGKIIFPGDSHDKTWDFILENYAKEVSNATVLIAPHHGRKSDRKHDFLDVVKPKLTLFGCAPSEHLDYSGWNTRNLLYFTNNQCGNFVLEPDSVGVNVYIENETFAEKYVGNSNKTNSLGYYFLCKIRK